MSIEQIMSLVLMIAFLFIVGPRVKHAVENSPKGSSNDWLTAVGLIGAVVVFVFMLTKMV